MWMLAGFAGGIQPWYHHISAYHEDRRMYRTAEPILRWHKANETYLVDRRPIASVGVVWSRQNTDYYGRDDPEVLVDQPWRGISQALVRARVPFLPLHVDDIDREAERLAVLVLPNLAALSDAQVAAVRRFVAAGKGLIATGQTSLYDEWGDRAGLRAGRPVRRPRGKTCRGNRRAESDRRDPAHLSAAVARVAESRVWAEAQGRSARDRRAASGARGLRREPTSCPLAARSSR